MPQPWWKPTWSVPAAMRAVRATIVVPALFAIADKVIGNPQIALFATFGGIATLVVAGFGGTKANKLWAHTQLAVVGSLMLIIGTLVSGTTWLAALVTVPVTFAIFFGGIVGPERGLRHHPGHVRLRAAGRHRGQRPTIPSRLEGWWMASIAGTIAVLLFSPPAPGNRLRAGTAELAGRAGRPAARRRRRPGDDAGRDARGQGSSCARRSTPRRTARPGSPPPTKRLAAWCSCSSGARRRSATRLTGTSTWSTPARKTVRCCVPPPACSPTRRRC